MCGWERAEGVNIRKQGSTGLLDSGLTHQVGCGGGWASQAREADQSVPNCAVHFILDFNLKENLF